MITTPRAFSLTAMLGLAWWTMGCGDAATEPSLPPNPVAPDPDRAVLVTLYEATGGDDWTQNDNWLSAAPIGEWYGVTVGADGRVVGLRLPRNNLSGRLPPELSSLSSLEELFLSNNDLSGPVPSELGSLSRVGSDPGRPGCTALARYRIVVDGG